MSHASEKPVLQTWKISDLRPLQLAVGLREVARKQADWRALKDKKEGAFLGQHMIRVIMGPRGRAYILDHHHMSRALHDAGVTEVLVLPVYEVTHLEPDEFWRFAAKRNWLHLYDGAGEARGVKDLPKTVAGLQDDPFRSLAGDLRRAGGFAKDPVPFAEFLWADFLRRRIKLKLVTESYDKAQAEAMALARSKAAGHLPGWSGPDK